MRIDEPRGGATVAALDRGAVLERVDQRRDELLGLLVDLVRIPSETHPPGGDEGPAQGHVADRLEAMGLDVDVFEPWSVPGIEDHPGWWPGLEYDGRPNVVGRYTGAGGGRSLILNGHIDVVPAGPRELWTHDPYGAEIVDGRLYGRGAADQKAGIASMIMALDCVVRAGFEPLGDVIIESAVNEELGGYNGTLACCVKGYEADAAIVTEPTDLTIGPASKGGQTYRAVIPGRSTHHAWWWEGVSALDKALVLKRALARWEEIRAHELRDTPLFSDRAHYPIPALADTIWYVRCGDPEIMATPNAAEMAFWVDVLPGEDREETLTRFEDFVLTESANDPYLRDHPPRLERALMRPFTGVSTDLDHPVVAALSSAHEAVNGQPAPLVGMGGASDAMIFSLYSNTPPVVFGPGNIRTAHSPDEFVTTADVVTATQILALTILDFCGYRRRGSNGPAGVHVPKGGSGGP
ncbi:MAG: ArgE/DapE family deacylase [Acidimicrobiales bacterium]